MTEPLHVASVATQLSVPRTSVGVRRLGRRAALCGIAAGAYYAGARLGYALHFAGPVAAIVWLPVGIGISFLYVGGLGLWPGLVVGDLLANDYSALPLGTAVAQTCGNLLELVVAVLLLRRLARRGSPLDDAAGVTMMAGAIALATALSATVGTTASASGGVLDWSSVPLVWRTWWLGDFTGALLVVPLVLAWQRKRQYGGRGRGGGLEGALILVAAAVVTEVVFRSGEPIVYLAFPVLMFAALRLGARGVTLALAVSASVGVWNTTDANGPFHFHSITHSIVSLQLYLAVASLSTLLLAAIVYDREQIARRLGQAQAQSARAASAERHRLERHLHAGVQNRLTAVGVRVSSATERPPTDAGATAALLRRVSEDIRGVTDDLRSLAQGLHPSVLASLGLADAIRALAERAPVPVALHELATAGLDPSVEELAYLTVADAIADAQSNFGVSSISVEFEREPGVLRIEVADNGHGRPEAHAGSRLSGLRERLETVGGTFSEVETGRGTRRIATIPIDEYRQPT